MECHRNSANHYDNARKNSWLRKNWGIASVLIFFAITLAYVLWIGDGIYLQVHDNLDSNIALYKMLKDNNLYWTIGAKAPFLGGIDRNYLFSDLKAYTCLYMFFSPIVALLAGWYIKIAISILGFYILEKTIYGLDKENISIFCGLLYGILPTFTTTPFSFASLPFLTAILVLLYRKLKWRYILTLFLFTIFSDFALFGIFICGYLLMFFIGYWIIRKELLWRFIIAIIAISVGFIITEWRLFYVMLFSHVPTLRSETYSINYLGWASAIKEMIKVFILGHYHSASSHTLIVLPTCVIYFFYHNKNKQAIFKDAFNWIMLLLIFNSVIYGLDQMQWFKAIIAIIIPPLKGLSFARTLWFNPFLWYFAFMIVLCNILSSEKRKFSLCFLALMTICCLPQTYNHIYLNTKMLIVSSLGNKNLDYIQEKLQKAFITVIGKEQFEKKIGSERLKRAFYNRTTETLSYSEFYSPRLFEKVKRTIGYNGEWSVAFGMHPSILIYNEISTLDGYLSYYPQAYKDQFRKLIEPDFNVDPKNKEYFDSWGGRAYLFSTETNYGPYRTSDVTEAKLLINPKVFKEMGGKYIFSRVKINNASELGLHEKGIFTDEKSPYTIYTYEK